MARKDDILTKRLMLFADGTQDRMIWQVFRGQVGISLVHDNNFKNAFRVSLQDEMRAVIELTIEKLRKADAGAKYPLVVSKWNPQDKKQERDYVITLGKDEQRIYYIEFDFGKGVQRFKFPKISKIQAGTDPYPEAEQSAIRMKVFSDWLKFMAPVEMVNTSPTQDEIQQARQSRGGGNDGGGSSGGGGNDW
jgi:hypothetical protein